jgi:hypothetical protein
MPDDWETRHRLNAGDPSDAARDADGDGFTNAQEALAGTDPRDSQDYLRIGLKAASNNVTVLRFLAVAGKSYTVQYCDRIPVGPWLTLARIPTQPVTQVIEVTDHLAEGLRARFYRLATP